MDRSGGGGAVLKADELVTAAEGATTLGVSVGTVWSWVARGQLAAVAGAGGRWPRYALADMRRVQAKCMSRKRHAALDLAWRETVCKDNRQRQT